MTAAPPRGRAGCVRRRARRAAVLLWLVAVVVPPWGRSRRAAAPSWPAVVTAAQRGRARRVVKPVGPVRAKAPRQRRTRRAAPLPCCGQRGRHPRQGGERAPLRPTTGESKPRRCAFVPSKGGGLATEGEHAETLCRRGQRGWWPHQGGERAVPRRCAVVSNEDTRGRAAPLGHRGQRGRRPHHGGEHTATLCRRWRRRRPQDKGEHTTLLCRRGQLHRRFLDGREHAMPLWRRDQRRQGSHHGGEHVAPLFQISFTLTKEIGLVAVSSLSAGVYGDA
jgi:hypothetical protein